MASIQQHAAVKVKFSDNIQATLSVKLLSGGDDDETFIDIYGSIIARFSSISQQFQIFDRKMGMEECILVTPGENIPLLISDLTVPTSATDIEIEAYLKDYDYDDEIANGKALFHVKASGESDKMIIKGDCGSIEVNVAWA